MIPDTATDFATATTAYAPAPSYDLTSRDEHGAEHSPHPHEPDLHIRFRYGSVAFDYLACRTAAENLLRHWSQSHHPGVSLSVVTDGFAGPMRLPCETVWLTR
ncbi:hypothetical protein [Nocardia bovistercoris]|uniref:Uncharacterized protein n=1 Tax=Nocardia bovistercoris TaxID=2785916 RepID=A0A931N4U0_9NOCA|nr:hypothetical protein [Nocardia bovistercoris]MBH0777968.1 hypothetical protein [Nocardia bovistercoris]